MLPTIVLDTREYSSAADEIRLRPATRSVTVAWKTGHTCTFQGVRRRDMLRLLDRRLSFGQWVNGYCWQ